MVDHNISQHFTQVDKEILETEYSGLDMRRMCVNLQSMHRYVDHFIYYQLKTELFKLRLQTGQVQLAGRSFMNNQSVPQCGGLIF